MIVALESTGMEVRQGSVELLDQHGGRRRPVEARRLAKVLYFERRVGVLQARPTSHGWMDGWWASLTSPSLWFQLDPRVRCVVFDHTKCDIAL